MKAILKWLFNEVQGLLLMIALMVIILIIIFVPRYTEKRPSRFYGYYMDVSVERPAEGFRQFDTYLVALDGSGEVLDVKPPNAVDTAPIRYADNGYRVVHLSNEYISVFFPPIQLSFNFFPDAEDCRWPSFSPDGQWISMTCGTDIYIMQPNGENLKNLTTGEGVNFESMFSPDSQRIFFSSQRDDLTGKEFLIHTIDNVILPHTRLYSMALDGSNVIPLTFRSDEHISFFGWFQEGD